MTMFSTAPSRPRAYQDQFLLNNTETNATVLPLSLVQSFDLNVITAHRSSLTSSDNHALESNKVQSILVAPSGHYTSRASVFEDLTVDETDSCCRICQLSSDEANVGPLISPCRCSGTLKFVHQKCLAKWLEVRYWRSRTIPTCELCHYQFQRHKKLKLRRCVRCPSVSVRDKRLHMLFLVCLLLMSSCVTTIGLSLTGGSKGKASTISELFSSDEVLILVCGVVFFLSFFVAAFVEIRVDRSFYRMVCDLIAHNVDWTIDEYDPGADIRKSDALRRTGLQNCQTAV